MKARAIAAGAVVFLAWLTMKFHMDNANDSETRAYVGTLLWNVEHATLSTDATGHYTALSPLVVWQFSGALSVVTDLYAVRGLALALTILGVALYGLTYAWCSELRLNWTSRLLGLTLLSISVAFVMLRSWELDKLLEPSLYLLGALLIWRRQYLAVLLVSALAVANRETGVFMPLLVLGGLIEQCGSLRAALRRWPIWVCLALCVVNVVWLRSQVPPPAVRPFADLSLERLVYVAGGLCLLPVLAVAWHSAASAGLRWLLLVLGPVWLVYVLATDRLEQGAILLAPVAVVCLPVVLAGLEETVRTRARAVAAVPEAPAVRRSTPLAPGT